MTVDFRAGNISPSANNLEFIKLCRRQLSEGINLEDVRIDAAGYPCNVIEHLDGKDIGFVIRARRVS